MNRKIEDDAPPPVTTIVASPSFGLIPNKVQSHCGSPLHGSRRRDPRFAIYIQRSLTLRFYRENRYSGKSMHAKGLARVQSLQYLKNKSLIKINGERETSTFSAACSSAVDKCTMRQTQ